MFYVYACNYNYGGSFITGETEIMRVPSQNKADLWMVNPVVRGEMGNAGSFDFTIPNGSSYFNAFMQMKSYLRVTYENETIFYGRVLTIDNSFYGDRKVHCEGALSLLIDSSYPGTRDKDRLTISVGEYITNLINNHNSLVAPDDGNLKRFAVGEIPGDPPNGYHDITDSSQRMPNESHQYGSSSWTETKSALEELRSHFGGYFRVRNYGLHKPLILDWVNNYFRTTVNRQSIEVGKNLIDLTNTTEVNNIFTAIIPMGRKNESGEDGNDAFYLEGSKYITVPEFVPYARSHGISLTDGYHTESDYLDAINNYGWIFKPVQFSEAETQDQLLSEAMTWIKDNYQGNIVKFTAKAMDMHLVGENTDKILIGDQVRLVYPVGNEQGVTEHRTITRTCVSIDYNLYSPDSNSYTFSTPNNLTKSNSWDSKNKTSTAAKTATASGTTAKASKASVAPTTSEPYTGASTSTEVDPYEAWSKDVFKWLKQHKIWFKCNGNKEGGPADVPYPYFYRPSAQLNSYGNAKGRLFCPSYRKVARTTSILSEDSESDKKSGVEQLTDLVVDKLAPAAKEIMTTTTYTLVWETDTAGTGHKMGHFSNFDNVTADTIIQYKLIEYIYDEYGIDLRTDLKHKMPDITTTTITDPETGETSSATTLWQKTGEPLDGVQGKVLPASIFDGISGITAFFNNNGSGINSIQTEDGQRVFLDADGDRMSERQLRLDQIETEDKVGWVVTKNEDGTKAFANPGEISMAIENFAGGNIVVTRIAGEQLYLGNTMTQFANMVSLNHMSTVCGDVTYETNEETGLTEMHISSGGGMRVRRATYDADGNPITDGEGRPIIAEFGLYDNNNLTAGVMIQKINDDESEFRINANKLNISASDLVQIGIYDNDTFTAGLIIDRINSETADGKTINGTRVNVSADQILLGETSNVESWITEMGLDFGELKGVVADKATIDDLNTRKAEIEQLLADTINVENFSAVIAGMDLVTIKSLNVGDVDGTYAQASLTMPYIFGQHIYFYNPSEDPTQQTTFSLKDFIKDVQVIGPTNNQYTLQKQTYSNFLEGSDTWVDCGNFSRAVTSMNGVWGSGTTSGIYTITPQPQGGPSKSIGFGGNPDVPLSLSYGVTHKNESDPTKLDVPVKVVSWEQGGSGGEEESVEHYATTWTLSALEVYKQGQADGTPSVSDISVTDLAGYTDEPPDATGFVGLTAIDIPEDTTLGKWYSFKVTAKDTPKWYKFNVNTAAMYVNARKTVKIVRDNWGTDTIGTNNLKTAKTTYRKQGITGNEKELYIYPVKRTVTGATTGHGQLGIYALDTKGGTPEQILYTDLDMTPDATWDSNGQKTIHLNVTYDGNQTEYATLTINKPTVAVNDITVGDVQGFDNEPSSDAYQSTTTTVTIPSTVTSTRWYGVTATYDGVSHGAKFQIDVSGVYSAAQDNVSIVHDDWSEATLGNVKTAKTTYRKDHGTGGTKELYIYPVKRTVTGATTGHAQMGIYAQDSSTGTPGQILYRDLDMTPDSTWNSSGEKTVHLNVSYDGQSVEYATLTIKEPTILESDISFENITGFTNEPPTQQYPTTLTTVTIPATVKSQKWYGVVAKTKGTPRGAKFIIDVSAVYEQGKTDYSPVDSEMDLDITAAESEPSSSGFPYTLTDLEPASVIQWYTVVLSAKGSTKKYRMKANGTAVYNLGQSNVSVTHDPWTEVDLGQIKSAKTTFKKNVSTGGSQDLYIYPVKRTVSGANTGHAQIGIYAQYTATGTPEQILYRNLTMTPDSTWTSDGKKTVRLYVSYSGTSTEYATIDISKPTVAVNDITVGDVQGFDNEPSGDAYQSTTTTVTIPSTVTSTRWYGVTATYDGVSHGAKFQIDVSGVYSAAQDNVTIDHGAWTHDTIGANNIDAATTTYSKSSGSGGTKSLFIYPVKRTVSGADAGKARIGIYAQDSKTATSSEILYRDLTMEADSTWSNDGKKTVRLNVSYGDNSEEYATLTINEPTISESDIGVAIAAATAEPSSTTFPNLLSEMTPTSTTQWYTVVATAKGTPRRYRVKVNTSALYETAQTTARNAVNVIHEVWQVTDLNGGKAAKTKFKKDVGDGGSQDLYIFAGKNSNFYASDPSSARMGIYAQYATDGNSEQIIYQDLKLSADSTWNNGKKTVRLNVSYGSNTPVEYATIDISKPTVAYTDITLSDIQGFSNEPSGAAYQTTKTKVTIPSTVTSTKWYGITATYDGVSHGAKFQIDVSNVYAQGKTDGAPSKDDIDIESISRYGTSEPSSVYYADAPQITVQSGDTGEIWYSAKVVVGEISKLFKIKLDVSNVAPAASDISIDSISHIGATEPTSTDYATAPQITVPSSVTGTTWYNVKVKVKGVTQKFKVKLDASAVIPDESKLYINDIQGFDNEPDSTVYKKLLATVNVPSTVTSTKWYGVEFGITGGVLKRARFKINVANVYTPDKTEIIHNSISAGLANEPSSDTYTALSSNVTLSSSFIRTPELWCTTSVKVRGVYNYFKFKIDASNVVTTLGDLNIYNWNGSTTEPVNSGSVTYNALNTVSISASDAKTQDHWQSFSVDLKGNVSKYFKFKVETKRLYNLWKDEIANDVLPEMAISVNERDASLSVIHNPYLSQVTDMYITTNIYKSFDSTTREYTFTAKSILRSYVPDFGWWTRTISEAEPYKIAVDDGYDDGWKAAAQAVVWPTGLSGSTTTGSTFGVQYPSSSVGVSQEKTFTMAPNGQYMEVSGRAIYNVLARLKMYDGTDTAYQNGWNMGYQEGHFAGVAEHQSDWTNGWNAGFVEGQNDVRRNGEITVTCDNKNSNAVSSTPGNIYISVDGKQRVTKSIYISAPVSVDNTKSLICVRLGDSSGPIIAKLVIYK